MNIPFELLRIPRLAGEAILRKLPKADLKTVMAVEDPGTGDHVLLRLNSAPNAETARQTLERNGYTVQPVEYRGTGPVLRCSRPWHSLGKADSTRVGAR